jgi:hypothetical protein
VKLSNRGGGMEKMNTIFVSLRACTSSMCEMRSLRTNGVRWVSPPSRAPGDDHVKCRKAAATSAWRVLRMLLLLFSILVLTPAFAQDTFTGVPRVVAVGDIHGGFDEMLTVLRGAGVISSDNRWTGGDTHLVQTGDVLDRGPHSRKVMDLLMDLEKQAQKAGGRVHALLGNHEAMNIYGDLRYVSPEEYAAFKRPGSTETREAFYQVFVSEARKTSAPPPVLNAEFRKKFEAEHPLGWVEHREAFGRNGKYGKWLGTHKSVVKINNVLFLHGGISPKYAAVTRKVFNETILRELKDFSKLRDGMVMDALGPLWYRGLAKDPEADLVTHVDGLLRLHGVDHIAVGHTPTTGAILPRFGGKVILIDVGLSKHYGANPACLMVEGSKLKAWHRGMILDLPVNGEDVGPYLKAASVDTGAAGVKEDP